MNKSFALFSQSLQVCVCSSGVLAPVAAPRAVQCRVPQCPLLSVLPLGLWVLPAPAGPAWLHFVVQSLSPAEHPLPAVERKNHLPPSCRSSAWSCGQQSEQGNLFLCSHILQAKHKLQHANSKAEEMKVLPCVTSFSRKKLSGGV